MSTARLMAMAASNKEAPRVAFVIGGNPSLQSIDISDPSSPTLLGTLNLGNSQTAVYDSERDLLFQLRGGGDQFIGLTAVDVSNPFAMSTLGSIGLSSETGGSSGGRRTVILDEARQIVYVLFNLSSSQGRGVLAIDVSNPSSMFVTSSLMVNTSGFVSNYGGALDLSSDVLHYVDTGQSAVFRVNVSNPASLSLLGSTGASSLRAGTSATVMALGLSDGKAYFVGSTGDFNSGRVQSVNLSGGGYVFNSQFDIVSRAGIAHDPINSVIYESFTEAFDQSGIITFRRGIRSFSVSDPNTFSLLSQINDLSFGVGFPSELHILPDEQLLFSLSTQSPQRLTVFNVTSSGAMSVAGSLVLNNGGNSVILGVAGPPGTRAYS